MTKAQKSFLQHLQEAGGVLYGWRSNPTAKALAAEGSITIEPQGVGHPDWAVFRLVPAGGADRERT